jgi:hypothetical protein
MAWAIKQKTKAPAVKVVLMVMANYADENGFCWPSQEKLAEDAGISRRHVISIVNHLADIGLVRKSSRAAGVSGRVFNVYQLVKSDADDVKSDACDVKLEAHDVKSDDAADVNSTTSSRELSSHYTIIEPIKDNNPPIAPPKQKPARKRKASVVVNYSPAFEAFWAAYPKRQGGNPKFEAWRSYSQLIDAGVSHDAIMVGTLAYAAQADDPRYIAQAVTFLNQRRFEDDYKPVAAKKIRIGGGFC